MAADPYRPPLRSGVWIRAREPWTCAGAAFGLLLAFLLGYEMIHAWAERWHPASWSENLALLCLVALFAGIPLVLSVRALRAAVRVDPHGVTIRGLTRTVSVPLREVEGFAPRRLGAGGLRSTVGLVLRRRGHRDLVIWALRHGEFSDRRSQEAAKERWAPFCEELDGLVRSLRGEEAATSGVSRP